MEPRSLRVLVVDDELLCRWATRQLLARCGHEVEEAASAEEALHAVERWDPNVVLLDIVMPGVDGLEVLARIRRWRPTIRIIMMTANATLETAVEAIRGGAVDYLTKPLNASDLQSALARVKVRAPADMANLVA